MAKPLDVTLVADSIAQVVVLRRSGEGLLLSKDWVVNNDTVNARIVVRIDQSGLYLYRIVQSSQFVPQSIGTTGLAGPLGVLSGSRVFVRQQTYEERRF
jgi:hypothetical protein